MYAVVVEGGGRAAGLPGHRGFSAGEEQIGRRATTALDDRSGRPAALRIEID